MRRVWISVVLGIVALQCAFASNSSHKFYSQASQDEFVYELLYGLLGKRDKGCYLEIGAGNPISINNSYFFEKNFQWNGISIDISDKEVKHWYSQRKNRLLTEDATQSDYDEILRSFPREIDYLSLDIDDHYTSVLKKIPFRDHSFKVITIEHDFYRYGKKYRDEERHILQSFGYHLLCSNVSYTGLVFEDWWVFPKAFPPGVFAALKALNLNDKDHKEVIESIRSIVHGNSRD